MVVVSCVTKDEPYMTHPNNLVGRRDCVNGVCTVKVCIIACEFKQLWKITFIRKIIFGDIL